MWVNPTLEEGGRDVGPQTSPTPMGDLNSESGVDQYVKKLVYKTFFLNGSDTQLYLK